MIEGPPKIETESESEQGTKEEAPELLLIKFEEAVKAFEDAHDFDHLHSLTDGKTAAEDLPRKEAAEALKPLSSLLENFRNNRGVHDNAWEEAALRFEKCSQAVGVIHRDRETGLLAVDHTRTVSRTRFRQW